MRGGAGLLEGMYYMTGCSLLCFYLELRLLGWIIIFNHLSCVHTCESWCMMRCRNQSSYKILCIFSWAPTHWCVRLLFEELTNRFEIWGNGLEIWDLSCETENGGMEDEKSLTKIGAKRMESSPQTFVWIGLIEYCPLYIFISVSF